MTAEQQYLNLCQRILKEGHDIKNKRTGKVCRTVINADFEYDVGKNQFPLITTRRAYWKSAIAEIIGYLKGLNDAQEFSNLGTNTWFANANENDSWLSNPNRAGHNDMGRVYGIQMREWKNSSGETFDQLKKVYNNIKNGIDDRGEILLMHNPGELDMGCLRACMWSHTFSLLGDTLHLTSYQRSIDVPLGLVFNMPQCFVLLAIMARITGKRPGKAYHKLVNCHIYEDQIELMEDQLSREPFDPPALRISDELQTFDDLMNIETLEDIERIFTLEGYEHHDPIKYPFSV